MYVVQPEREMKLAANKNRASLLSGPGTSNHTIITKCLISEKFIRIEITKTRKV